MVNRKKHSRHKKKSRSKSRSVGFDNRWLWALLVLLLVLGYTGYNNSDYIVGGELNTASPFGNQIKTKGEVTHKYVDPPVIVCRDDSDCPERFFCFAGSCAKGCNADSSCSSFKDHHCSMPSGGCSKEGVDGLCILNRICNPDLDNDITGVNPECGPGYRCVGSAGSLTGGTCEIVNCGGLPSGVIAS